MPEFRLETERLILRDWRSDDWEQFLRHTNTPAVMRWLGGTMDDEAVAAMPQRFAACREEFGHCFWVVERKGDGGHLSGELLGFCGLKRASQENSPLGEFEIGWRLRQDAWGRGYAREAAAASLRAAFEKFGAPRVIAITLTENEASWGLMERLGMRRSPELDFVDPKWDPDTRLIVYSIDRAGWEQSLACGESAAA